MKNFIKKNKQIVFIFLLVLATVCCNNNLFAQSLENGKIWQLQNPSIPANIEIIGFSNNKTFCYITNNFMSGKKTDSEGTYKLLGNNLILNFKIKNGISSSLAFTLTWINSDKITLTKGNNVLIFARIGSFENKYIQNMQNQIGGTITYGGTNGQSAPQTNNPCYPCNGTGQCLVCNGKGVIYGNVKCPSCLGSGRCKYCNGTGISPYH